MAKVMSDTEMRLAKLEAHQAAQEEKNDHLERAVENNTKVMLEVSKVCQALDKRIAERSAVEKFIFKAVGFVVTVIAILKGLPYLGVK